MDTTSGRPAVRRPDLRLRLRLLRQPERIGGLSNLGEKALGSFRIITGFWLFYLMFADILNTIFHYTLFIWPVECRPPEVPWAGA